MSRGAAPSTAFHAVPLPRFAREDRRALSSPACGGGGGEADGGGLGRALDPPPD
jgi:hypothetical protein